MSRPPNRLESYPQSLYALVRVALDNEGYSIKMTQANATHLRARLNSLRVSMRQYGYQGYEDFEKYVITIDPQGLVIRHRFSREEDVLLEDPGIQKAMKRGSVWYPAGNVQPSTGERLPADEDPPDDEPVPEVSAVGSGSAIDDYLKGDD